MKNFNNDFLGSSIHGSANEKDSYIFPSFSVDCVGLESSMAVTSYVTSKTTPEVTDWDDESASGDIWLND